MTSPLLGAVEVLEPPAPESGAGTLAVPHRRRRLLRILRRPTSIIAIAGVVLLIVLALGGQGLAPYDASALDLNFQFSPPVAQHLFGTDELGRDIFSRVIVGARYSVLAVVVILALALAVGTLIGSLAGYVGGLLDEVLMRLTDIFLAFPGIVLALAIAAALGPNLVNGMLALAAIWWPTYARLVRGQVLAIKNNAYVEAARSLGSSHARIIVSHILRNGIAPILVQMTLDMGNVLVTFAGLSFLGLGAAIGTAEWGAMVNAGATNLLTSWWLSTFPGLAIFLTALVLNMLGDTVQDILAPGDTRRI
jgi:peptide/nickel transport system permease protein